MSFENPGDNIRCDHCNRPGVPYEYRGITFSGLHANQGDRLCPDCNGRDHDRTVREIRDQTPVTVLARGGSFAWSVETAKRNVPRS